MPTSGEWIAAGVASGLVVVLLALHLLRPVLARSRATAWGRAAGLLLGCLAVGFALVTAIAVVAGMRADTAAEGAFAGVLVHPEPPTAERIGGYVAALLLPLAAVVAVLAVAVVDVGRPSGLRVPAGITAGVVLAASLLVARGDPGSAAEAVAWSSLVLSGAAAVALVADEVTGRSGS